MNVIFDADGTIYDFKDSIGAVYRTILSKYNMDLPAGDLHERIINSWYKVCLARGSKNSYVYNEVENFLFWKEFYTIVMQDFGYEFSEPAFLELWDYYAHKDSRILSPGIESALAELKDMGCHLGAVSNFDRRFYALLYDHGLSKYFDFILSAVDVGFRKPADGYFLTLQKKYKLDPARTVHVGNEPDYDHFPALKLGWKSLVYDPKCLHLKVDSQHSFKSFADLPGLIKSIKASGL